MRAKKQVPTIPVKARRALQRVVEQLGVDLVDVKHPIILVTGTETGDGVSSIAQWLLLLLENSQQGDLLYVNASSMQSNESGDEPSTEEGLVQQVAPTHIDRIFSLEVRNTAEGVGPGLHDIARALDDLRERFQWIVIDAPPPSCFSPRSSFLVQQADGVLLVVEANRTDRDHAQNTVELIRQSGGKVVGALINKSKS